METDPTVLVQQLDNARIAVLMLIGMVMLCCMALLAVQECDPDCGTCQAKRNARAESRLRNYYGKQWCETHRQPRFRCPPGSHG